MLGNVTFLVAIVAPNQTSDSINRQVIMLARMLAFLVALAKGLDLWIFSISSAHFDSFLGLDALGEGTFLVLHDRLEDLCCFAFTNSI